MTGASWRLVTPPPAGGAGAAAIAVVEIVGDVEGAFRAAGIVPVEVGGVRVRSLAGIDQGVAMRPAGCADVAFLTPHAGPAVLRGLLEALIGAGIPEATERDERDAYPEAASRLEARMLAALARAASPLAVELLLDQPRRWRDSGEDEDRPRTTRDVTLRRLLDPPLVAAVGGPNIGKSSLLNALAGSGVALVADSPGTTRDHVGVSLDLAGLVVRYIDVPGIRSGGGVGEDGGDGGIGVAAEGLALGAVSRADLILLCGDSTAAFLDPPFPQAAAVRVGLRGDRGPPTGGGSGVVVSVRSGHGLPELVALVRERLLPEAVLGDGLPWRFW